MLSTFRLWTLIGLLGLGVKSASGGVLHHYPHCDSSRCTKANVTIPTTCETHPQVNLTITSITTVVSTLCITRNISVTDTTTITISVPETIISNLTVPSPTTVPTTDTATVTVPTTITPPVSYSTYISTLTTSIDEECPTTCSIAAGTVRLFFWPTSNNDHTYPSTYVSTGLDYTFTSPSVYLVINTIYGTNSLGRAGPSGTSEIFAVNLDEVSTIVPENGATQQLTLNDLHTDCPQSLDPEVIATTIPDGHCDFSLLAPQTVKQWALPCNACGRFGLFDPPYAIPPLGGGFIESTITTTDIETTTFASTTAPDSGPSSTIISATATSAVTRTTETSAVTHTTATSIASPTGDPTTTLPSSTPIVTASASKVAGDNAIKRTSITAA
ncbi:hypothetical protein O1611_g1687 [Lasiodiplodia mahajangana]|uniref:Uncharacterized protein n=1 Tax=Lasiodiplodia mahajangana TaxID=1108764 RepID=A0ACC2JX30_9PEZI|nr:hypothetical protein O1611_g1687 [Lasiodiplodia mahajangana]